MNVALAQPAPSKLAADLIILNAIVRTMETNHPLAQAVAVTGNRIAAVGATQEIRLVAGAQTRMIDAAGRLVLPGFNDAHVHFLNGGFELSGVNLRDAKSPRMAGFLAKRFPWKRRCARLPWARLSPNFRKT